METRQLSGTAELRVSDGCGGIPDLDLARMFEPGFSRPTRHGDAGGAGLGLAIARAIVEAHAGEVTYRSQGAGCVGVLRLPLADGPQGGPTRSAVPQR